MTQTGYEQQTEMLVVRNNSEEEKTKARLAVASFALNQEDCKEILSALGLLNKK